MRSSRRPLSLGGGPTATPFISQGETPPSCQRQPALEAISSASGKKKPLAKMKSKFLEDVSSSPPAQPSSPQAEGDIRWKGKQGIIHARLRWRARPSGMAAAWAAQGADEATSRPGLAPERSLIGAWKEEWPRRGESSRPRARRRRRPTCAPKRASPGEPGGSGQTVAADEDGGRKMSGTIGMATSRADLP